MRWAWLCCSRLSCSSCRSTGVGLMPLPSRCRRILWRHCHLVDGKRHGSHELGKYGGRVQDQPEFINKHCCSRNSNSAGHYFNITPLPGQRSADCTCHLKTGKFEQKEPSGGCHDHRNTRISNLIPLPIFDTSRGILLSERFLRHFQLNLVAKSVQQQPLQCLDSYST